MIASSSSQFEHERLAGSDSAGKANSTLSNAARDSSRIVSFLSVPPGCGGGGGASNSGHLSVGSRVCL